MRRKFTGRKEIGGYEVMFELDSHVSCWCQLPSITLLNIVYYYLYGRLYNINVNQLHLLYIALLLLLPRESEIDQSTIRMYTIYH